MNYPMVSLRWVGPILALIFLCPPQAAQACSCAAFPNDLEKAVAALPPQARMVFVLHDVEGYRHAEIGRLLDVAEGTSKAQLHRARKILREALRS